MITECTSLLLAAIVVLSTLGINISGLLLPAGVVLAIASRDLLHNFIAGERLLGVQPTLDSGP
jgi:small-conductance mechanosensitive channel